MEDINAKAEERNATAGGWPVVPGSVEDIKAKAENGDAAAQYGMSARYDLGVGVEKDEVEAVKWARRAAEQDHVHAQYSLGVSYSNGTSGVGKDYVEAAKWFRKAAEQNDRFAQISLGKAYENGQGVERDYAEAYAWWNLASITAGRAAQYRDELEQKMSSQQIADAQKRTKELRAVIEAKAKSGDK